MTLNRGNQDEAEQLYQPGDRVVVTGDRDSWNHNLPVGTEGVITKTWHGWRSYPGYHIEVSDAIHVNRCNDGTVTVAQVDLALALACTPPTEEELAEVYRSLGVKP